MPVLADVPTLVRGLILQGIRKQMSPAERVHFVPILQDAAEWKKVVQFAAPESADGRVWYLDLIRVRLEPLPQQPGWRDSSWVTSTSSSRVGIFDRDGGFWHADEYGGIWRFLSQEQLPRLKLNGSGPSIETFNAKQGLSSNSASCVLEDSEGNVWVGTDSGLDRFRHRNLSWYSVVPGPHLFSLVAGDDGHATR